MATEASARLSGGKGQAGPEGLDTATAVWRNRAVVSAAHPAFRHRTAAGTWNTLTYAQADQAAREIAVGLLSLGVAPGDRVCILSQSRIEWMLTDLAICLTGAASVPIYASNTAEQCTFIVRNCGAKLAIVEDAAQLEKLLPLVIGGALSVVHIGGDAKLERPDGAGRMAVALADVVASAGGASTRIKSFDSLREDGRAGLQDATRSAELDARSRAVRPEDVFTIIYTSGTTGEPKGVVLTQGNLAINIASACRALTIHPEDEQLLFLPLAHVFAREIAWAPIERGAVSTFAENIAKVKENLTEVHPTFMAGVPRVFEKFYSGVQSGAKQGSGIKKKLVAWGFGVGGRYSAEVRAGRRPGGLLAFQHAIADKLVLSKLRAKLGLDRCRFLVSGGAPLAPQIAEFFHGVGLLVLEGYGLTETMSATHVNQLQRFRFGTVGPAIDVVDCKIGNDGEILMRGPTIFREYWQNPAATAEALDPDGWFHTGDIGHIEDGFLRITDRKKDLIVLAGGKKIAPQMLENALKARSRLLSQVVVYGDKRPYCVALVTLNDEAMKAHGGDHATAAAAPEVREAVKRDVDALNATLASFETIKRFAILPADLSEQAGELTPSMKVKRKLVVEKYRDAIDRLYEGSGD